MEDGKEDGKEGEDVTTIMEVGQEGEERTHLIQRLKEDGNEEVVITKMSEDVTKMEKEQHGMRGALTGPRKVQERVTASACQTYNAQRLSAGFFSTTPQATQTQFPFRFFYFFQGFPHRGNYVSGDGTTVAILAL